MRDEEVIKECVDTVVEKWSGKREGREKLIVKKGR